MSPSPTVGKGPFLLRVFFFFPSFSLDVQSPFLAQVWQPAWVMWVEPGGLNVLCVLFKKFSIFFFKSIKQYKFFVPKPNNREGNEKGMCVF